MLPTTCGHHWRSSVTRPRSLCSPRSAAEYCQVLENLLEETNRLSHLADQLLFLCRQDSGLLSPSHETLALDDLLREVVGNMQLVAGEKGVALSLEENPPCQLPGDRHLLLQVLYNLLDNAIKYTGASGKVMVSSKRTDGRWSLVVFDSGVGIAAEHLPRVFDRFYRVDPSRTGDGNGAGLGLSICQSIVKALGGRISLESTAGKGTKVQVILPIPH